MTQPAPVNSILPPGRSGRSTPMVASAIEAFEARVAAAWPAKAWQDVPVVVAVSGGADSVALLRVLARLQRPALGCGCAISTIVCAPPRPTPMSSS